MMRSAVLAACCGLLLAGPSFADSSRVQWPHVTSPVPVDPAMEKKIAELLARMTLEQKIGQMVQAEIRDVTPEDVRKYRLGSILNGGGAFPGNDKHATIADWVKLADRFYDASMDTSDGRRRFQ
jgi:beta-glucosidase